MKACVKVCARVRDCKSVCVCEWHYMCVCKCARVCLPVCLPLMECLRVCKCIYKRQCLDACEERFFDAFPV